MRSIKKFQNSINADIYYMKIQKQRNLFRILEFTKIFKIFLIYDAIEIRNSKNYRDRKKQKLRILVPQKEQKMVFFSVYTSKCFSILFSQLLSFLMLFKLLGTSDLLVSVSQILNYAVFTQILRNIVDNNTKN